MSKITQLNGQQFESEVLDSQIPVLVEFDATGCAPCLALEPILKRLAVKFAGQVKSVRVNRGHEPGLAYEHSATAVPALILIDEEGRNEGRYLGSPEENDIRTHLLNWIAFRKVVRQ